MNENMNAVSFDMTNSNFWSKDLAGDDFNFLEILEERRQMSEKIAIEFARASDCNDYVNGLRWSEMDFKYSAAERVLDLGLFFHMDASDRSIEIAIAHMVGLAKYAKFEGKSHAVKYGRGRASDGIFGNLSRLMYADEVALTLTDATAENWAKWVLEWLEHERVDVRNEMSCGGESIVLRYEHLLSYSVGGVYEPGAYVDIQEEMRRFDYVDPRLTC